MCKHSPAGDIGGLRESALYTHSPAEDVGGLRGSALCLRSPARHVGGLPVLRLGQTSASGAYWAMEILAASARSASEVVPEERIASILTKSHRRYRLDLPIGDGAGAAWLHQHGEVIDHWVEDGRAWYEVRMAPSDLERFQAQHERT